MNTPLLCDAILEHGTVIDGSGNPRFPADVGVTNGRITFVGDASAWTARDRVNVSGLIIAPGFIDSHAHDDWAVLATPEMPAKVSQGVTTVINGNCGNSLAPYRPGMARPLPLRQVAPEFQFDDFADYLQALDSAPASVNVASLIGHTALRVTHMRDCTREATREEIKVMQREVNDALLAGAIGLSTGTFYPPAAAATANEIAAVGNDLARHKGIYATHMRDESDDVLGSIDESALVAARMNVPLVISHHKVIGRRNFGRSAETLGKLEQLSTLQPVNIDCYPYTASSSLLRLERLALSDEIIVTSSRSQPSATGQTLSALAQEWQCTRETAMQRVMPGTGIYFIMHEDDVRRIIAHPLTLIGSDGISSDDFPHPRLWGTFPRVLGRYCRELGCLTLENAIHKMTGKTANTFNLPLRGHIIPGHWADITVFDPERIADTASYASPQTPAYGIHQVFVNGRCVWRDGRHTSERPGTVIRRTKTH